MKSLVFGFFISFFTFSMAFAQVGIKELNRRTKDFYSGDPSVVVKTETNIRDVVKSWGFTQFIGTTVSDEVPCSVMINQVGAKTFVTITNFAASTKIGDAPRQTTVEFKSTDRVLESLSRGLESISAKYDVVYREQGNRLVPVAPEPLLKIGDGEGMVFVEISDFGHKAECSGRVE